MVNSHEFFVSYDPATYLDHFQGITWVFNKMIYERNQTMYNYMVVQIQIFKLQMQPQSVSVSGLSLFKVTS